MINSFSYCDFLKSAINNKILVKHIWVDNTMDLYHNLINIFLYTQINDDISYYTDTINNVYDNEFLLNSDWIIFISFNWVQ